jgi:predicted nucleic acid-binding protein
VNVVSDASPLIILAKIGWLDLLSKIYSHLYISAEVYAEVVVAGTGLPGAVEVAKAEWIEVKPLQQFRNLAAAQARFGLGLGELSTILLAKELGAALVLMDEESGRWLAREEGLEVRGTVGIVERLYQRKEIPDLREAFQTLLAHQAHLGRDLLNRRLELFGLPPL